MQPFFRFFTTSRLWIRLRQSTYVLWISLKVHEVVCKITNETVSGIFLDLPGLKHIHMVSELFGMSYTLRAVISFQLVCWSAWLNNDFTVPCLRKTIGSVFSLIWHYGDFYRAKVMTLGILPKTKNHSFIISVFSLGLQNRYDDNQNKTIFKNEKNTPKVNKYIHFQAYSYINKKLQDSINNFNSVDITMLVIVMMLPWWENPTKKTLIFWFGN